eukprot:TRINITY_DN8068_c0_g1_i2.p1 TRINITY_DN8068_c0_g1~~TRINITY_DN8068_c0_g1_i2.p1  ORF type:complete len:418 (-),score=45.22 TRINITY_DN8068_c0_g1_i2:13-1266(-)
MEGENEEEERGIDLSFENVTNYSFLLCLHLILLFSLAFILEKISLWLENINYTKEEQETQKKIFERRNDEKKKFFVGKPKFFLTRRFPKKKPNLLKILQFITSGAHFVILFGLNIYLSLLFLAFVGIIFKLIGEFGSFIIRICSGYIVFDIFYWIVWLFFSFLGLLVDCLLLLAFSIGDVLMCFLPLYYIVWRVWHVHGLSFKYPPKDLPPLEMNSSKSYYPVNYLDIYKIRWIKVHYYGILASIFFTISVILNIKYSTNFLVVRAYFNQSEKVQFFIFNAEYVIYVFKYCESLYLYVINIHLIIFIVKHFNWLTKQPYYPSLCEKYHIKNTLNNNNNDDSKAVDPVSDELKTLLYCLLLTDLFYLVRLKFKSKKKPLYLKILSSIFFFCSLISFILLILHIFSYFFENFKIPSLFS